MARGKKTCKILKDIRRQIAEANDIKFITSECRYKGDCLGTCPKCEAEVRYLEEQLRARSLTGKAVALAGISAGMLLMPSCSNTSTNKTSETLQNEQVEEIFELPPEPGEIIEGDVEAIDDAEDIEAEDDDPVILVTGDVEYEDRESSDEEKTNLLAKDTVTVIKEAANDNAEDSVFVMGMVEMQASFPGGVGKLYEWLSQNVVYPQAAAEAKISGKVVVDFRIEKDGSIDDIRILRGVCEELDSEAVRVVRLLPKFKPGQMNGEAVATRYCLPISFKINEE